MSTSTQRYFVIRFDETTERPTTLTERLTAIGRIRALLTSTPSGDVLPMPDGNSAHYGDYAAASPGGGPPDPS